MPSSLSGSNGEFFLKGEKIKLISGAVHYFRIVPEYWEDRLRKLKFCGLNCVETYVPWNLHEEVRGEFNFTGMLDLRAFIKTAQYLDLYVILRPGPYICSEWDFGGLPSWLLSDPNMKVRSSYNPYLEAVGHFFNHLLPLVVDLQHCNGGPIICVQLENEYGSYGDDLQYMKFLKENMLRNKIEELLCTSDNGGGLQGNKLTDVLMTTNFQEKEHGLVMVEYVKNLKQPGQPTMVMEFWTGWFDHWGEGHKVVPTDQFERTLTWILDQGGSVNFYMFHGGTNFGFTNGANEGTQEAGGEGLYTADVTSYDYDAPVSECGELSEKFFSIKKILEARGMLKIDEDFVCPLSVETRSYGRLQMTDYLTLGNMVKSVKAIESEKTLLMEHLPINNGGGQSFGFILYRARVPQKLESVTIKGRVRDRAVILVNGQEAAVVDRMWEDYKLSVNMVNDENVIDVLVENMGRVNYADFHSDILNQQRKGVDDILINGKKLDHWSIYPLEFKKAFMKNITNSSDWKPLDRDTKLSRGPHLYRATLNISEAPRDTFIQLEGWCKGNVFVNNFNLGRYWEVGPQRRLYVPAPLLKQGDNQIVIFELHSAGPHIDFCSTPDVGDPVIHKAILPAAHRAGLFILRNSLKLGSWVWYAVKPFAS